MNERPTAIAALLSCFLGVLCFLILLYASNDATDILIILFVVFIFLTIVLSGISLFIKRNTIAWIAFFIGAIFSVLFLVTLLLLRNMCVIC